MSLWVLCGVLLCRGVLWVIEAARSEIAAPACRRADDGRMSPTSAQAMSMLVADLVGSTAIADRIGPVAPWLRSGV